MLLFPPLRIKRLQRINLSTWLSAFTSTAISVSGLTDAVLVRFVEADVSDIFAGEALLSLRGE